MRFYINEMVLWLRNGEKREIPFENDKINVITGNSKTGKTAILEIIDYCLCGSKDTVVISYEHIGENVTWYGIRFSINDKLYTIARGPISEKGVFSDEYYFSQTGEIPDKPYVKMRENQIKNILEKEFSIDDDLTITYGGKGIKKGRLSFRYFLILNTLSKDIVDNGKIFFDKLNVERYRDVWSQVFDLAMGVINRKDFILQNNINKQKQLIANLEKKQRIYEQNEDLENQKEMNLVKKAKQYHLINEHLTKEEALFQIKSMIKIEIPEFSSDLSTESNYVKLLDKKERFQMQLIKLKKFRKSYNNYKDSLKDDIDSLKPVTYIEEMYGNQITGEYRQFISIMKKDLESVKLGLSNKKPFEFDVDRQIKGLENEIQELDTELEKTPDIRDSDISVVEKLIHLGEIKAEYKTLSLYNTDETNYITSINEAYTKLEEMQSQYISIEERRDLVIKTLNEFVQIYIDKSKDALDEYGTYCAWFDYKKQQLTLKRNKSASIAQISSSSDHLFMHLCLFAGMHNMLLDNATQYIPSYLIIDQPTRPYFNNSEYDFRDSEKNLSIKDDWSKVKDIFMLWDEFLENIKKSNEHFQIIMLEHVSEEAWKDCKNVNLVKIFDGKKDALIPLNLK